MYATNLISATAFWAFIFLVLTTTCSGLRLTLYDEPGYEGIFYNQDLTYSCQTLPPVARKRASSLKTDSCIIVYTEPNCKLYSFKILKGDHTDLKIFYHTTGNETISFDQSISSFMLCNEVYGGTLRNIDLYGYHEGKLGVMLEYRSWCGCLNLPRFSFGQIEKIDNYGNCIELYDERGCATRPNVTLQGGFSSGSNDLGLHNFDGRVKAIKPCSHTKIMDEDCGLELAVVVNAIKGTDVKWDPKAMSDIAMAATTRIYNNGPAEISQDFSFAKKVEEKYTVERSYIFRDEMYTSFSLNAALELSLELELIPYVTPSIELALALAYSTNHTTLYSESEKSTFTHNEEKIFTVSERVSIPSCTEYEINSYVKVSQDVQINYSVTVHITGTTEGYKQVTAERLLRNVPGSSKVDAYTVELTTQGTANAIFGLQAFINGTGKSIENCKY